MERGEDDMKLEHSVYILLSVTLFVSTIFVEVGEASDPSISVSPTAKNVRIGEEFTVNVDLDYAANLYGFEIWLSFDNAALNASAFDYTGYLNEPTMIWYQAVNNQEGWVSLSVSSKHPASAKAGGGNLAVVHFKSLAAGTSTLHLYKTHLVNDQAMEISHSTSDGQVTVTSNAPPVASNLVIDPSAPFTADSLIVRYDYYDADGDLENGTEVRWYRNGVLQPAYNNHLIVPSSATLKVESWYFTVRPKDGKSFGTLQTSSPVTVQDTPPVAYDLTISPSLPRTTDDLVRSYLFYDADGDVESGSEIRWYKNDVLQLTFNDLVIVSFSATAEGEDWHFTVKPKDGTFSGALQVSTAVTIQPDQGVPNTPPVASNLTINPSFPKTIDDLIASYEYYDVDGDSENGTEIRWYKNGVPKSAYSDQLIVPSNGTLADETWFFTVKPKDGKSFGTLETSSLVTVSSVEHDVAIRNVTVSKTIVGKGCILYVNVTGENRCDVTETCNITCYANMTIIHAETVTLFGLSSVTITFAWNTTQAAIGNYIINASATPESVDRDIGDNTYIYGWIAITISGDLNCDGTVNIIDLMMAARAFNSKPEDELWNSNADVNDDRKINILDIFQLANWWWQFQLAKEHP